MKFSQRKGYSPIQDQIQIDWISEHTRIQLWNVLWIYILDYESKYSLFYSWPAEKTRTFGKLIYMNVFNKTVDSLPDNLDIFLNEIKAYLFNCKWFEVFDFLEAFLSLLEGMDIYEKLVDVINETLGREKSGYRFISGICTDLISEQEINEINTVLSDNKFPGVQAHIQRSIELLYDRDNPDYRNSMKESISAVESMCKILSGKKTAVLSDALKTIVKQKHIHPALSEAFIKIYGYSCDENGIRHSLIGPENPTPAEARFFLVACTAFTNYLKTYIQNEK